MVLVEELAMVEGLLGEDVVGVVDGVVGGKNRVVLARAGGFCEEARRQRDLMGDVVSPPFLGRLHRGRLLRCRRHGGQKGSFQ